MYEFALLGLSAKEMANRLFITEATVRSHLASIYEKSGVHGRIELMARQVPEGADSPARGGTASASQPPRRHLYSRRVIAIWLSGMVAVIFVVFVVWSLIAGQRPTLQSLRQDIESGDIVSLDLRGDVLTAMTADGHAIKLENIGGTDVESLPLAEVRGSVTTSAATSASGQFALMVIMQALPWIAVAGSILLVACLWRWGRESKPGAGPNTTG